jgi:hypothetical protein
MIDSRHGPGFTHEAASAHDALSILCDSGDQLWKASWYIQRASSFGNAVRIIFAFLFPPTGRYEDKHAKRNIFHFLLSILRQFRDSQNQRKGSGTYPGKIFTVTALEYFEFLNCQEKIYPPHAMRRIQASSPAYAKSRPVRRAS